MSGDRIGRLELQVKLLALVNVAAVIAIVSLLVLRDAAAPAPVSTVTVPQSIAAAVPPVPDIVETLRVRALEVVDRNGKVRGRWSATKSNDGAAIAFLDGSGQPRIGLTSSDEGTNGLALFGASGKVQVIIGGNATSTPAIALMDPAQIQRLSLSLGDTGPVLMLRDGTGTQRAAMSSMADGGKLDGIGSLVFFDKSGKASHLFGDSPTGPGSILVAPLPTTRP